MEAPDRSTGATSDDARATEYHARQFRLTLASIGLSAAYLIVLVLSGAGPWLQRVLAPWTGAWWQEVVALAAILGGAHRLISLPLDWIRGFRLPRAFGLVHQPASAFVLDLAKGLVLSGALGLLAVVCVYGLMRVTAWWWLWGALVFTAGYALLAWIAPVWLVPLFYRLTPLADEELRGRLVTLGERARVPVIGAWVVDESRKSRLANAAVTGLGRTRRILLFDTLLQEFNAEQIEAVLAHEMGHHAHRDVWRGLAVSGLVTLLAFWIVDRALSWGARASGLSGPADPGGLPLFGLILFAVSLAVLPLYNGWSRRVERQADDFAITVASRPAALLEALDRLAALNLAERHPHPLKEAVFHSHPAIGRRLHRLAPKVRQPQ